MTTTADEVWELLRELIEAQKETERGFQETKEILKQQAQESEKSRQETERLLREQSQETERLLKEQAQETEWEIQQLSREVRQVSKQISSLGGKWGRFVENMVAPACETIFADRGIPVHEVRQRVRRRLNGDTLEVDVLVDNQSIVVAVEVKSSLGVEDIKEFMADLPKFKQFFPEYAEKQLYGAVAGIEIEDSADIYAYRQGLFVLAQSGETMDILNNDDFEAKAW